MVNLVTQHQYSTTLSENEAFAFGFSRDSGGRPVIGEGTDDDPCMITVSTKSMMRDADHPSDSYVFHMDATFKLNTVLSTLYLLAEFLTKLVISIPLHSLLLLRELLFNMNKLYYRFLLCSRRCRSVPSHKTFHG
ncbi:unnamed protein product [Phytophthora fragariaefolia]|uniref:Unnamed protein product n=1 Tax=Phytophthora fragariaefolia TaxID=1490495 RepID=A0A9W6U5F7_9STRA|nr:unnamed protein product [Phytophthora fragariaefolia]